MAREYPLHGDLNLIVTGYVEPNRPRISRQLATRLGLEFIDVERQIEERSGDSIAQLRARFGDRRMKAIETEVMDGIMLHRRALVRVSGSTVLNSGHLPELQRNGLVICLVASLDSILRRMHLTLGGRYHSQTERARAIGELQQEWRIRDIPDVIEFDTTYITEAVLIEQIVTYWRDLAIRRG